MANDEVTAVPSASRNKPPSKSKEQGRRSGGENADDVQSGKICIVEKLAAETAAILRLRRQLGADFENEDSVLIDALKAPDDFLRPDELKQCLWDRQMAIEHLASHRQPKSIKGALFQLYIAASASRNPAGLLHACLSVVDEMRLNENNRHVVRLHYSSIGFLESLELDDDLRELRRWYLKPIYDVERACELALYDQASLLEEARRQPTTASSS